MKLVSSRSTSLLPETSIIIPRRDRNATRRELERDAARKDSGSWILDPFSSFFGFFPLSSITVRSVTVNPTRFTVPSPSPQRCVRFVHVYYQLLYLVSCIGHSHSSSQSRQDFSFLFFVQKGIGCWLGANHKNANTPNKNYVAN